MFRVAAHPYNVPSDTGWIDSSTKGTSSHGSDASSKYVFRLSDPNLSSIKFSYLSLEDASNILSSYEIVSRRSGITMRNSTTPVASAAA
jgi:hypothetical protein